MRRTLCALLAPLLFLTLAQAAPLKAQVQFGGLEGWAGYGGWNGDDFRGLRVGIRAGGAALLELTPDWKAGLEVSLGRLDYGFNDSLTVGTRDVDEVGVSLLVRRTFVGGENARLYGQFRGGWTQLKAEPRGAEGSVSQGGFAIGPEVGVAFPASPTANVLFGVGVTYNSYGESLIFGPTDPRDGLSASGLRWGVRLAVALGAPR